MNQQANASQMTYPHVPWTTRARKLARFLYLQSRGHWQANRYSGVWWLRPVNQTARALVEIRDRLGVADFGRALEYGCHNGRVSPAIRAVSRELWGIDIVDVCPYPLDRYVKVTQLEAGHDDYLPSIETASVDSVVVVNLSAFLPDDTWGAQMDRNEKRMSRYLTPGNFPRILKPGGHLILLEEEFKPEKRFRTWTDFESINAGIGRYYPHPELVGFKMVLKGFSRDHCGPYIVYQRH